MPRDESHWRAEVLDAERRGEPLEAFDRAEQALAEHPDSVWFRHRAVLALARAGSTDEADRRFAAYGLDAIHNEDVQALGARIAKDRALIADGDDRRRLAAAAAAAYGRVYEETGGYYPAVNAATLWLLAGRRGEALSLAAKALTAAGHEKSYYAAATRAEALLILDEPERAQESLADAAALADGDYAALATTRRQLRVVCAEADTDPRLLAAISGPAVVHYCGHRISGSAEARFPASAQDAIRRQIDATLDAEPAGFGYGALASGADILIAEALLARGAELHVVLPFGWEEFVRRSVADSGADWVARFADCLERATSVRYATDHAGSDDDVLYRYGAELAMGLALLRARFLDARVRQIAVWDGHPARGEAGTAIDVATWTSGGRRLTHLQVPPSTRPPRGRVQPAQAQRIVRAMLFADVKGFSRLTDEQLPRFFDRVLGELAGVLHLHADAICYCNTWGDALYIVLTDPKHAAACALDLQHAMHQLDLTELGLPAHLALRLGGHVGPVFPGRDPIIGTPAFFGTHVSRTARIEPITPPGSVYVTEAFAASLILHEAPYASDYVGHIPAAKDFGRLRMYRLRPPRTSPNNPST